jgi:uncharacterized protein (TIGR02117 family)
MNFVRWISKWLLLAFVVCLCGCANQPRVHDIPLASTPHKIHFIYRGWHTSILVDATTLAKQSPLLAADLKGQKYARIGWGDGDYFTGKNKSTATAAKALVASGYSAVQLLAYDDSPFAEIPPETRVALAISDNGMRELIAYVNHSIALDSQGRPLRLPSFGGAQGAFFQSTHHYGLFSNCNSWSGRALRAAGLPVNGRLTAQGVFEQAKFISQVQSERGQLKK